MSTKFLLSIFSIFLVTVMVAQSNFNVEKGNLSWTKTYESEVEVKKALKKVKALKGLRTGIPMRVYNITNECGKTNVRNFMKETMNARVLVRRQKGSYKVTVYDILFTDNVSYGSFNTETGSNPKNIEDYVLKEESGKVMDNKATKNSLACINETLTALFTFTE